MENTTLHNKMPIDSSVLYFGLNGFGITWSYFIVNLIFGFVALTGLFLNVFSIWATRQKDHLMDISIMFISNLACCDFINDIMCLYLVVYGMVHYKNYYECAFRFGLALGISFNSGLQLLALTLDRFTKIIYPYQYVRIFQERSANIFCVLSWLFSALLGLLPIFGARKPMKHGLADCSFFGVLNDFYLILMTTLFILVLITLVLCYIRICWASFNQSRRIDHGRIRHVWSRPTKTIIILIIFYCLCWLPVVTCIYLHLTGHFPASFTDAQKGTVLAYCGCLVYLDTIANPVIYALKIKTVKKRWQNLLVKLTPRNKPTAANRNTISNPMPIEQVEDTSL